MLLSWSWQVLALVVLSAAVTDAAPQRQRQQGGTGRNGGNGGGGQTAQQQAAQVAQTESRASDGSRIVEMTVNVKYDSMRRQDIPPN